MRLYVTPEGRWAGTQADAKKLAREGAPGRWAYVPMDVATDKHGLLEFLNERRVPGESGRAEIPEQTDEEVERKVRHYEAHLIEQRMAAVSADSFTASEIQDFILNRATVAQVESIFACLGTRFAERRAAA